MPPPDFLPGHDVDDENPLPVRETGEMALAMSALAPLGYEQIPSVNLVSASSLNPPPGAMRALVQNNGGSPVRWRDDGTDPIASVGMRIDAGDDHVFVGDLLAPVFIDEGANAVLDVSYYG